MPLSAEHKVAALLPWYVDGRLEGEEHARVRAHLEECAECAARADLLRWLAEGLRGAAEMLRAEHPEASLLLDFAEEPESINEEARAFLRAHLRTCPPCRSALERTRAVLQALGPERVAAGSRWARVRGALHRALSFPIARPGFAVLALSVLLLLMTPRTTEPPGRSGLAEDRAPAVILREILRSGEAVPTVPLPAPGQALPLEIRGIPVREGLREPCTVTIEGPGGELIGGGARALRVDPEGNAAILLRPEDLAPGSYAVRVFEPRAPAPAEPILTARLRLLPPPEGESR